MHTLCPSRQDDNGPRTVKLLAVSSLGRIVVYSELQSSDDRVKVAMYTMLCVCVYHYMFSLCMCAWKVLRSP